MTGMYVKIFSTILGSSVWAEDYATRIVWIAMLAMADQEGVVRASDSGIARMANVSPEEGARALERLSSPDPESQTQEHDGRRIERLAGAWLILNYVKYRDIHNQEVRREQWRRSQRKRRQQKSTSGQPRQQKSKQAVAVSVAVSEAVSEATETTAKAVVVADNNDDNNDDVRGRLPVSAYPAYDALLLRSPAKPAWMGEIRAALDGMHGVVASPDLVGRALADMWVNNAPPEARRFRRYLTGVEKVGEGSGDPMAAFLAKGDA